MFPSLRRRLAPLPLALLAAPAMAAPPFTLAYRYHLPTTAALQPGAISVIANDFTFDGRIDLAVGLRNVPLTLFIAQTPDRGGFAIKPLPVFHNYVSPVLDRRLISAGAPNTAGHANDIIYPNTEHSLRRVQRVGGLAGFAAQHDRIELPPYNGSVGLIANLIASDFNGDFYTDVAIIDVRDETGRDNRTNGVIAWGRPGQPTVDRSLATVANPYFIVAADFVDDAARRMDLLVANQTDTIGLSAYETSPQRFALRQSLTLPDSQSLHALTAGDLDGDGKPDALATYRRADGSFRTSVVANRGSQGLVLGPTLAFGDALTHCIGDFNADGTPDVLVDGRRLELGRGSFAFDTTQAVTTAATYGLACADFNGDGQRDFAVAMDGPDNTMELRIYQYDESWDRVFADGFQR